MIRANTIPLTISLTGLAGRFGVILGIEIITGVTMVLAFCGTTLFRETYGPNLHFLER